MDKSKARQNVDSNGNPIQALMPKAGGTEAVAADNESAVFTSNVVRLLGISESPRIRFGVTGITPDATDLLLVLDVPEYFSVNVGELVAVTGGAIEVTNMEV